MKIGSWNIKRGLVTKENEIKLLLKTEKFDILFLNETDTKQILSKKDYQIEGFETIIAKSPKNSTLIRIICLVKIELMERTSCNEDLMSPEFPSIWLEIKDPYGKKLIIGGFYREWAQNGLSTEKEQEKRMEMFTGQIDKAAAISNQVIILGDANLCMDNWNQEKFLHKNTAELLKSNLEQNG